MHAYTCMHTCMHAHMHTQLHTHQWRRRSLFRRGRALTTCNREVFINAYTYMYIYITYKHVCMRACMHTHMHTQQWRSRSWLSLGGALTT